jgi:hypothetical protein
MKADRKRLKAEKADVVNQMQQLYATLESREEQLRDFIRNYDQHRKVPQFRVPVQSEHVDMYVPSIKLKISNAKKRLWQGSLNLCAFLPLKPASYSSSPSPSPSNLLSLFLLLPLSPSSSPSPSSLSFLPPLPALFLLLLLLLSSRRVRMR